ncbi:MAG TPA: T9SS type A sorting domain-containing protein, partial [Bacteroidales bacterium]|nr:T9SS type A sorting domain-containing protein [Bacteroidales bacterium]
LYTILTQIPSGIARQMLEMQAYNPFANTPGKLEQEIKELELEKQLLLNHFIRLLTDTTHNRFDDAIRLLEAEISTSADRILAGTYISINEYELATDKISVIPDDNKEDQDFKALNELVLSYFEQGKSLYELDSTELEFIRDLAYACPLTLAGANAQSILSLLFREEFDDCPPPMGTRTAKIYDAHLNAPEDPETFSLGDNYPDPADNYTIIPYTLESENEGVLEISDASGKIIATYKLNNNEHEFRLNTQALVPGIYNYSLISNNGKTETKKFAIYR